MKVVSGKQYETHMTVLMGYNQMDSLLKQQEHVDSTRDSYGDVPPLSIRHLLLLLPVIVPLVPFSVVVRM